MAKAASPKGKIGTDTPSKRGRLTARRNPYWAQCGAGRGGLYLGYRKPLDGAGAWVARLIREGVRSEGRLGQADDAGAAPGALSYSGALTAAMEWATRQTAVREHQAVAPDDAAPTVQSAVAAYVAERKTRHDRHGRNAETRLARHLPPGSVLALKRLDALHERDLAAWARSHAKLSAASVLRLLNDMKAALNKAHETHYRILPPGWKEVVARGLRRPAATRADAPAVHHREVLTDADMRALVAGAFEEDDDGDFGRLVAVVAATGARFSQVARLTVADVIAGPNPQLMLPASAKGRPGRGHKPTHLRVDVPADLIAALRPALAGRTGPEPLLTRWRMRMVAGDKAAGTSRHWERDRRVPWTVADEMREPWARTVARAKLPAAVTPYRLRDASIIRGLRVGQPVQMVAKLHDTSPAMVERHYAQHIADALSEVARLAVVPITSAVPTPLRAVG